ncbi:general secretion pathway protein GspK [Legionella israelensis]|uniref:type II secretion system minor pseudopilin GspK n=1 Tax=Legionella israelensis TaxID=454 RepID=UPI00117FCBB3|nr:type II secretion system minor pseudopilin GspK [Legionella israelensis]QDP72767.1 general secretion pathway protein GspK [Legionella israelensis]
MKKLRNHPFLKKVRGSALLSALFIMTLVAIAATAMTTRLQLDIYRTRLLINNDKFYLASQAVTFWAMNELNNSKNQFKSANNEGIVDFFPKKLQSIYPDFKVTGHLVDLQSKININSLVDNKTFSTFNNLLLHLLPSINSNQRRELILAIHHWISEYRPDGANPYLSSYLKSNPPYLPAHQFMRSLSELRLVKDVNQSVYQNLFPYLTALPEKTAINIHTAPKLILMSLGNGLKESQAEEIMQSRKESDFKNLNDLARRMSVPANQITTESNYFLSVATVTYENLKMINYSILKRSKNKKNKISVMLISETLNSL